jgi:MMPL family
VSIALNLLSVGAAYGLLTIVFLHGDGASLLGFQRVHAIEAWVPLFLFSVLDAVAAGVASTARIITGAALIIIVVFTGFARGQLVMFQQMGFGVAVALLLDATLIRSVLLPSALALLGEHSWSLPRWLHWLPRVSVEEPRVPSVGAARG